MTGEHEFMIGESEFMICEHEFMICEHEFMFGEHEFMIGESEFMFGEHEIMMRESEFMFSEHEFVFVAVHRATRANRDAEPHRHPEFTKDLKMRRPSLLGAVSSGCGRRILRSFAGSG
jgi:hypothetical protein